MKYPLHYQINLFINFYMILRKIISFRDLQLEKSFRWIAIICKFGEEFLSILSTWTFLKQFGNFYRYFSTNKARFAFWTWKTISIRPRIVTYLHLIHSTSVVRCHLPICEVVERLIMNESALDVTTRMCASGDLKNCNKNTMFLSTWCY